MHPRRHRRPPSTARDSRSTPRGSRTPARRSLTAAGVLVLMAALGACQAGTTTSATPAPPSPPAGSGGASEPAGWAPPRSWAPAPRTSAGLIAVATTSGRRMLVHTAGGDRDFLPGVNLGATTPGHGPGELAIAAEDYRRWFAQMGGLGLRAVRIYTVHPPAFYDELAAHNRAHADAPLYLVAGVYLPDESYVTGGDLYAPAVTDAFAAELTDAVAAVHGDLSRPARRGHAAGTWLTDVSAWVAGYIVGVEWDPAATRSTNARRAGTPAHRGPAAPPAPGAPTCRRG